MKRMKLSLIIAVFLSSVAQAVPNFPCGTFTVTGSAANWKNLLYTAENDIMLQAVATNGVILAETQVKTADAGSEGRNFALRIPLSTRATEKTAAVGDSINLFLLEDGVTNVAAQGIMIGSANSMTNVALRVVNGIEYASSGKYASGGKVRVSSAYIDGISSWLDFYGKSAYEPDADYDGDGVDNYTEYLSGTNPFDASDKLSITAFERHSDRVMLRFEYSGGVVYGVGTTTSLATNAWTKAKFAQTREAEPEQRQVLLANAEDEDAVGTAEVYLIPVTDSPAQFYRVNVESERNVQ